HILPFAALLFASWRAGRNRVPTWWLVLFGLFCTVGFLPLLLPLGRERLAIEMGLDSIWLYVARTAAFAVFVACFCACFGMLGRRRAVPEPGRCVCGYDLTGNTSGVCPECGTSTSVSVTAP